MANKYTNRELLEHNFNESDYASITTAQQQKTAAEQALANLGDYNFTYGKQNEYDNALNAILNRKKFSYDLNGDALYQQYKDNYINQGKMAMMDTMGQAAAMTGGYGNSYAATVGNQAYQASLQNLNNIVPELYKLALESYNAEGDRLNNNLGVLGSDRQLEENSYSNKYNANLTKLSSDRDYYSNNYNDVYNKEYSSYVDHITNNNDLYWNEYNTGYQKERDAIADQQWQKSYNLQQAQISNNQKAAAYDAIVKSQKNVANAKSKILSETDFKKNAKATTTLGPFRNDTFGVNPAQTTYTYNKKTYDSYNDYVFDVLDSMDLTEDEMKTVLKDLGLA